MSLVKKPFNDLENYVHVCEHGLYFGCGIFALFLTNIMDDGPAWKTKLLGQDAFTDAPLSRMILDCFALFSLGPGFEHFLFILMIWDYLIFICQEMLH